LQENQPKKKKTKINIITILESDGEHTEEKITDGEHKGQKIMNAGKRICKIEAELDEENEETHILKKLIKRYFLPF
jgi:hypothetical protein